MAVNPDVGSANADNLTTYFAPAGRARKADLLRDAELLHSALLLQPILDAMPTWVLVLNDKRQIVAANQELLKTLRVNLCNLLGQRPGEAVGCAHACEGADGCGTGPHCITCGAVGAIMESQKQGTRVTRECRVQLASQPGEALDLRVTAVPLELAGNRFTTFAIEEISDEKRLEVLSRTFFHDVLNTAGCVRGCLEYLVDVAGSDEETKDAVECSMRLANEVIEQIKSHRDLSYAERGDLDLQWEAVRTDAILMALRSDYVSHTLAKDRTILLANAWPGTIVTDVRLLTRVLGNMLKNALEACDPGDTVTLRCVQENDEVVFSVHNAGVMPKEVQLQVFQRSYSTKQGKGRGIGTHSMKLLGERYLGGKVSFTSEEPYGTTFRIIISKEPRLTSSCQPQATQSETNKTTEESLSRS